MIRLATIALLGRADTPTDAVEEYCWYLSEALRAQGIRLTIERVPWEEGGWGGALQALRGRAKTWKGLWVIVQYTALAWSSRGFPLRFSRVLEILKGAGVRVAVVYHDVEPFAGTRIIDLLRRQAQLRAMRHAMDLCDVAVFTRSEEHTSELQSRGHLVCRLLLEKKK